MPFSMLRGVIGSAQAHDMMRKTTHRQAQAACDGETEAGRRNAEGARRLLRQSRTARL